MSKFSECPVRREDYTTNRDYLRALIEYTRTRTPLRTIESRYGGGERNVEKLVAPAMSRSVMAKRSRKTSPWSNSAKGFFSKIS